MIGVPNLRFSRWWAPLVGMVAVPYLLVERMDGLPGGLTFTVLGIGAVAGGGVGLLVMLIDPSDAQPAARGELVPRFLAVASLVLSWCPCVGLALGLLAVVANWDVRGWPRFVAWSGLILGLAVTAGLVAVEMWPRP